jgi:hypothetical protein
LRRADLAFRHDSFFKHPGLQPFANQPEDALISDPVFQEPDQPLVADCPEGNVYRLPISKAFLKR